MSTLILLIPLLPLFSATFLVLAPAFNLTIPKPWVARMGVGAVGAAAVCVAILHIQLKGQTNYALQFTYANWINVHSFTINFGFYLDALSLVMVSIITGVGFLIHLYSAGFMDEDKDYQRYFAYLNAFVAAMLVLVLADNLLLLYLGWESVGLCSYLLIGFWHHEINNTLAANKAFIMTRIGDTGMALGLFLIFYLFGTLDIQAMQLQAQSQWQTGDSMITLCCLLLLAGAVGKSGQLPLQSWLPDAMAGPTPVSALIHAATMVTAGVYLIARCHNLFELSPLAMECVAYIGAITLFIAATAALVQQDVKRILAYSTISQIGYMFLALGAGAWSAAVFHLMTHAFFKALLFLSAGALIFSLHHEHNIFRMGGLAKKLPMVCVSFLIGCSALAALPLLSGFFSKELILNRLLEQEMYSLWLIALIGAFVTAFYSFRLFFVVFLGKATQEPDRNPLKVMVFPLLVLGLLAIFGGIQPKGLAVLFSSASEEHHNLAIILFTIAVPLCAVAYAWRVYKEGEFGSPLPNPEAKKIHRFLFSGWGFDAFYQKRVISPFIAVTKLNQNDIIDSLYIGLINISAKLHRFCSQFQSGQLRWYNNSLVIFAIVAMTWVIIK
ncbi:MAG: NADH-quinone oxidoreductase subunit L [Methylococcales bacterium]